MDNDSRYSKKTSSDLPTNSSTKLFAQPAPLARSNLRQTIQRPAANGNIRSSDEYEEQKDELSRIQELMMAEQNSIFDMHHDFIEAFIGCIKSDSEVYQGLRNEGTLASPDFDFQEYLHEASAVAQQKEKIIKQLKQRVENYSSRILQEKALRSKIEAYENLQCPDDSFGDVYDLGQNKDDDFELLDDDTN